MSELYSGFADKKDLCDALNREVRAINEKMRAGDGKLSPADAEYLDHITHAMISLEKSIGLAEKKMWEEYDNQQYKDGYRGSDSYGRMYYGHDDYMGYGARGRSRDSMGRYRDDDTMGHLRDAMNKAPNERARRALSEAIQEMERA